MTTITTADGLRAIAEDMAGDYELGCDIDLSWIPLGTSSSQSTSSPTLFTGTLNGNGHAIKNLTINRDTTDNYNFVGLFGRLGACTIQNLVIKDAIVTVSGRNPCVGILAGHVYDAAAVVSNVSTKGDITVNHKYASTEYAYRGVGGMVGSIHSYSDYSTFTDCISNVSIKISGCDRTCYVSGFMGYGYRCRLTRCYAFGDITVTNTVDTYLRVSGMQAYCYSTTHTNCACAVNIIGASSETVSECCKYLTSTSSFTNNSSRRYWQGSTISWESYSSDSDVSFVESDLSTLIGEDNLSKYNMTDLDFSNGKYLKLAIDVEESETSYDITIKGVTYNGVKHVIYNGSNVSKLVLNGTTYEFE